MSTRGDSLGESAVAVLASGKTLRLPIPDCCNSLLPAVVRSSQA